MKINMKKILVIFILILSYILLNLIFGNTAFAINQTTTTDINSIDSNLYPGIKEMIQQLKNEHPNWNFKILYTDIDWNEAIANEYVGHGGKPRNLVPANNSKYAGDWICPICGNALYDTGKWHCASESAIKYMMDPRNSLNNSDVFQFMELTYTECNANDIRTMVSGTFLNNDSYINAILDAARKNNVSAYYIVARILQEQKPEGTALTSGTGYNGQYVGYYNVFNIGASGKGESEVILNGLKKAQSYGWTTLESSIYGGVEIIAESYVSKGQNTLYFQKFDVENTDGVFWHQYMQNILAAQNEGTTLRKTFEDMGAINSGYTFIIPVFKNMPTSACPRPSTTSTTTPTTNLVRVNVNNGLRLRNEPNGSKTVGWVYSGDIITRLEKATEKIAGTYWDYVMKPDGTKGYAARETYDYESTYKLYLVPVEQEQPEVPDVPEEPEVEDPSTIIKNDKVKVNTETNEVRAIPNATVKDIKDLLGAETVIKNANGEVLSDEAKLATGCTVNDTYSLAVLGDVNGDGEVDTGDTYLLKLVVLDQKTLDNEQNKMASDVNQDGEIDTGDTYLLKKQVLGMSNITI